MVNISLFRHFVPLQSLVPSDRVKLAKSCSLRAYEPDQVVQGVGGRASVALYLVEGEIELRSDRGTRRVVAGGDEARHALGSDSERSASLACIRASRLLLVDRQQLDLLLTWSQTGGVEVVDLAADTTADEGDWMTAMLQSQAFEQIPPANIAQIFAAMEPCEFAAGEIIVRQGDPGDYYYVITEGRCQVVVSDESGMVEHEVAQLGMGRSFGEEALVSGNPRNATVRALTRSGLMRLAGRDFERLLKNGDKGLVFFHHSVASWAHTWPEYREVIGATADWGKPLKNIRGKDYAASGALANVQQRISVVDKSHPITAGVEDFDIVDEAYLFPVFEDSVIPLLRTDFKPVDSAFPLRPLTKGHPPGSNLTGWVKTAERTPVAYIQHGHDNMAWANPSFRKLLSNAINWAASPEAKAWARANPKKIF